MHCGKVEPSLTTRYVLLMAVRNLSLEVLIGELVQNTRALICYLFFIEERVIERKWSSDSDSIENISLWTPPESRLSKALKSALPQS